MTTFRLEGLEPDNLLAFLAMLGLLRAIETTDDMSTAASLRPRISWDPTRPPLRPSLHVSRDITLEEICSVAADGIQQLVRYHDFSKRKDLNYTASEAAGLLRIAAEASSADLRYRGDLFAALMTDAAVKDEKRGAVVDPTPFCLLFGQGHQHFLERLAIVPATEVPSGSGRSRAVLTASQCLYQALFEPWHRRDATFSFRWDPEEDVRHALMAGDPTSTAYKSGTQHGANRLAAVGLSVLTLAPVRRSARVRPAAIGGFFGGRGFSFAWPIWREPATLAAIRALLSHPELRTPGGLAHLGVDHVFVARRISVGKFMNFTRAQPIEATSEGVR